MYKKKIKNFNYKKSICVKTQNYNNIKKQKSKKSILFYFFSLIYLYLIYEFLPVSCAAEKIYSWYEIEDEFEDEIEEPSLVLNDDNSFNENNTEKNSWFNFKNIFFGSIVIFVLGLIYYYYYNNGFPFWKNDDSTTKSLVYYRRAIIGYISFDVIEQYKYDMHTYFINDKITMYDIFYHTQQFLDHPEERSGRVAIRALEKILNKLIKHKHHLNVGDTEKAIETLRALIFELKSALIKGLKD